MEDTEVDLSLESAAALENPDRFTVRKWRGQRAKIAGCAVLTFALGIGGLWFHETLGSHPSGGLVERTITAPRDFLTGMFVLAMTGAVVISPFVILFQFGRLLIGLPKAPNDPVDTVRQFYRKTVNESSGAPYIDAEAYLYLLTQARKQFADINDFSEAWKKVVRDLQQEIISEFQREILGDRYYVVKGIREISSKDSMKTYEIDIEATYSIGYGTTSSPKETIGSVVIQERCTAAPVGGRWYLTSGRWKGRLIPTVHVGERVITLDENVANINQDILRKTTGAVIAEALKGHPGYKYLRSKITMGQTKRFTLEVHIDGEGTERQFMQLKTDLRDLLIKNGLRNP